MSWSSQKKKRVYFSKGKTVMSWNSQKKKEDIFCIDYFVRGKFFNICVLSQCIMDGMHFQNIHIFTYQKALLHTLFCLFLKQPSVYP